MTTLPIPKLYWDVFQTALQSKVKRLAKEVATCLGQSEQPLLKALTSQKVDVYLFEEEGSLRDRSCTIRSSRGACRMIDGGFEV